jgi:hypothetical protein
MSLRKEEAVQNAFNPFSKFEICTPVFSRPCDAPIQSSVHGLPQPHVVLPRANALPRTCIFYRPHAQPGSHTRPQPKKLPRRQPCSQPSPYFEVTSIDPRSRALLSNTGIATFGGSGRRTVCAISITIGQGYEQQKACAMQGQRSQHDGDHTSGRRRWRWSCMRLAFQMNPLGERCLDRVGGVEV